MYRLKRTIPVNEPGKVYLSRHEVWGGLMKKAQNVIGADVDLNGATSGFKNFGQFVAAMNVSENLHIDFSQLKAAMTGTDLTGAKTATGTTSSLGQAIQKLKPTVDANAEAAKAERQATAQINADSD